MQNHLLAWLEFEMSKCREPQIPIIDIVSDVSQVSKIKIVTLYKSIIGEK